MSSGGKLGGLLGGYVWILMFVILRNTGAQSQSEFLNDLEQYHVVVPSRVTRDGNHVTYDIHPGHSVRRRSVDLNRKPNSDDTLHYRVQIEEKDYVIQIDPNFKLTSPGFVVERLKNRFGNVTDSKFSKLAPELRNCHYHGHVINGTRTKVAVGVCNGLHGFIHTDDVQYFIEPLLDDVRGPDGQHRHVVYRRSALVPELDPLGSVHVHKRSAEDDSCGNKEFLRPEKRRERWEKHHRHARQTSDHHRQKRSFSTERYVETLIVVDPSMVKYHKNEHLETYVLTIMNMVAAMFHDASIGNSVNIILVRILLIEEKQKDLSITHHADRTLTSFCKFQKKINFKDDDHPNHHDVAVLLTRKNICSRLDEPCSTLGLAQVSGMCQPHWSCNINEDTGLALAYTVTHELGHNFGMHHDGKRNGCEDPPGRQLFLMSPSLVADSLTKTWSNCSRAAITKFIDRDWGYCLNDEPGDHEYNFPVLPSGTMYNADHQCRLQYGTDDAKICTDEQDVCANLWCKTEDRCSTRLEAAAEGTICGENKWCYQGKCVKIGDRPESINGEWGQWTAWSDCTKTCGGGVAHSQRHCDNPQPSHGGKYCLGERKRYRICNTEDCEEITKSFNQMQCEEFNFLPYKNHYYEWDHVLTAESPCQLHCKPKNRFFSSLMKDIVTDGTPCTPGTPNMCISGRCRHIGCDFVIDSTAKEDQCGVCHGDGSTCTTIKAQFNESKGLGYVEATVIPRGARNIHVHELADANNFLALQNDEGEYYLNGHWFIQWSGSYEIAGTTVQYTRVGNKESFQAPGPLKEPLHIMLLLQSKNPGVAFEYTVPKENISEPRTPQFNWIYLTWTHCTASCGGGTQRSEVVCSEIEAGVVDDKYCFNMEKPDDKQKVCNDYLCPARWWTGPWQHCSVTCGEDGTHQRTVICVRSMGLDEQIALDDEACDAEQKPPEIEPCHKKEPCPGISSWVLGEWSKCGDNPCGLKYRSVSCQDPSVGCDETSIPPSELPCTNTTCGQWVTENWSQCPVTCGMGQQEREVKCDGGDHCDGDNKPARTKVCVLEPCPLVTSPVSLTTRLSPRSSSTEATKLSTTQSIRDEKKTTLKNLMETSTLKTVTGTSTLKPSHDATESSLSGKKMEDVTELDVNDDDNDEYDDNDEDIEIESFDEYENIKENNPKADNGPDALLNRDNDNVNGNIESEYYAPEQENIFDNEPDVNSETVNLGPVEENATKPTSTQMNRVPGENAVGIKEGMKVPTTTEKTVTTYAIKPGKPSDDTIPAIGHHKHRHNHRHNQEDHQDKQESGENVDNVNVVNTDKTMDGAKDDLVLGKENKENDYHIVEENYNGKDELKNQALPKNPNVNVDIATIKKTDNSDIKNVPDKNSEELSVPGNVLNKPPNLEKLPVLPDKVPDLPDISNLPTLPKLEDLKPIPVNPDLTKFDIKGLPKLKDLDNLPQLPDLKDLPKLPDKDNLVPLPDINNLPPLPSLPELASPKQNLLPPKTDTKDNTPQIGKTDNLAPLPDISNPPSLPDSPNKGLFPPTPDKLEHLPRLPNKEDLVPVPDLKELPPLPDMKDLPKKDLLSPDIDSYNIPSTGSKLSETKTVPKTKSTQLKEKESEAISLSGPALEIKKADITNIDKTTLPQQVNREGPAITKPVSETNNEINELANDNDDSHTRDNVDINVEIPEMKGDEHTVLKSAETVKSKDEIEENKPENHSWRPSKWTECSRGCGDGVRTRTVSCVNGREDVVEEVLCDINTKPGAIGDCYLQECREWRLSQWSQCSASCGYSVRYRNVVCPEEGSCDPRNEPIREELCSKPDCVKWVSGQWSRCNKQCDGGEQVRLVQCVNLTSQLSSRECPASEKPPEKQTCNTQPCKERNAALTIKCEHNEMSSVVCRALRRMGQCHRRFVSLKCCKTCNKESRRKLNKERPRSRALR